MHHQPLTSRPIATWRQLLGLGTICLPTLFIVFAYLVAPPPGQQLLLIGGIFLLAGTIAALFDRHNWRDPANWAVLMLYLVASAWMEFSGTETRSLGQRLLQGSLLLVGLLLLVRVYLRDTGALTRQRAQRLVNRLSRRNTWPADLRQIRQIPEVQALAECVGPDPSPIFTLVVHPRVEVRMAGLCVLEYRTRWLAGQPRYLLGLLKNAPEPEIKSAILLALACTDDRAIVEAMCDHLWDPSPEVRRSAVQALLWSTEDRWPWMQTAFRQALCHPNCAQDGPLISPGMLLRSEVIVDLVSWTAEKGILAQRAAMTLGVHYDQVLRQGANITQLRELEKQVVNPHTPAFWRLEIARLLGQHREVSQDVAQTLLNPSNPAALRLLAVETLLGKSNHQQALAVLVEVARLPNREMALAAAEIVQRRLNVHLGLENGHALPPTHTRQAAEIVRNVLLWADRQEAAWSHVPAGRSYDDDF